MVLACLYMGEVHAQTKDTVRVMFYNILNFPSGGGGISAREDTLAKIISYVEPDVVMFCELVNVPGMPDLLLNKSFNVGGISHFQRAPFVTNTSTSNNLQQLVYFNADKLSLRSSSQLPTDLRDINKYILYYNDPNLPLTADSTFLDVYTTHLKASTGFTNENRRNTEVTVLRDHLNTNATQRNSIFGADFNMYTSSEMGYQTLTTTGTYPLQDPIASPGNWSNNPSFAAIHTQSTRVTSLGGDGATSGLDDRLDQILASSNIMSGIDRVRYIPATYRAVGQDGNHYNLSVIDLPANGDVPANIANALYYMSDHLPVVMDLEFTLPTPVPVRVSYLAAEGRENEIAITGKLEAMEVGTKVELQRRHGENAFETIAEIDWNVNGTFRYDDQPQAGLWHYRLVMSDANGHKAFSENVHAWLNADYEWNIATYADGIEVFLTEGADFDGMLEVSDMTGRQLYTTHWSREEKVQRIPVLLQAKNQVIAVRLKDLESGWQSSKRLMLFKD